MATTIEGNQAVRGGRYFKLVTAPLLGLVYVVALPAIALAAVGLALARRLTGRVARGASELAATVAPDVATGAAHLSGHDPAASNGAVGAEGPELEALTREVEQRRRG
jgi:hypothetical protein